MKKFLALVLTFAMVLGVVAVPAGAETITGFWDDGYRYLMFNKDRDVFASYHDIADLARFNRTASGTISNSQGFNTLTYDNNGVNIWEYIPHMRADGTPVTGREEYYFKGFSNQSSIEAYESGEANIASYIYLADDLIEENGTILNEMRVKSTSNNTSKDYFDGTIDRVEAQRIVKNPNLVQRMDEEGYVIIKNGETQHKIGPVSTDFVQPNAARLSKSVEINSVNAKASSLDLLITSISVNVGSGYSRSQLATQSTPNAALQQITINYKDGTSETKKMLVVRNSYYNSKLTSSTAYQSVVFAPKYDENGEEIVYDGDSFYLNSENHSFTMVDENNISTIGLTSAEQIDSDTVKFENDNIIWSEIGELAQIVNNRQDALNMNYGSGTSYASIPLMDKEVENISFNFNPYAAVNDPSAIIVNNDSTSTMNPTISLLPIEIEGASDDYVYFVYCGRATDSYLLGATLADAQEGNSLQEAIYELESRVEALPEVYDPSMYEELHEIKAKIEYLEENGTNINAVLYAKFDELYSKALDVEAIDMKIADLPESYNPSIDNMLVSIKECIVDTGLGIHVYENYPKFERLYEEMLSAVESPSVGGGGGAGGGGGSVVVPPVIAPDTPVEGEALIKASKVRGLKGHRFEIDVEISNNPGFASMMLNVEYDSNNLKLVEVIDNGKLGNAVHSNNYLNMPYILAWENDTATENITENGIVATLVFESTEFGALGIYPITINYSKEEHDIFDTELNPVDFAVEYGEIEVADFLFGDVNSDEEVNTLDRLVLTRHIAKWVGFQDIDYRAADLNQDGFVNSLDRAILARYLANWVGYDKLPWSPAANTCTVTFDLNYEGATGAPSSQTIAKGNNATEPAMPEREGFLFAGWYKDQLATEAFSFEAALTSNITLYAKWIPTDGETITRGEWIALLLNEINAEVFESANQTNYYGDTAGSEYEAEIEAAKAYGIIPADEDDQDVPLFRPDEIADREFVAVTVVLAMGFVAGEETLDCTDKYDLLYPALDLIAVREGFITLINNHFYPTKAIFRTEINFIIEIIRKLNASVDITEEKEEIDYSDVVTSEELKTITDYTVTILANGNYLVKIPDADASLSINENEYFILAPNAEFVSGLALKAILVYREGGYLVIEAMMPEDISKIISHIVFSGKATVGVYDVKLLHTSLSYTYDPSGAWNFDFGDGFYINGDTKIKGQAQVTIPDISAYLDAHFNGDSIDVNELTLSISHKAKIISNLECVYAEDEIAGVISGSTEFARVPFALGNSGLSVDLVFSLYYDMDGSVSIEYTVESTHGIQYRNGNFRFLYNYRNQLAASNIDGNGQIGMSSSLYVKLFEKWNIIGINSNSGVETRVSVNNHASEGLRCVDGTIYLSSGIKIDEDSIIGEYLKANRYYELSQIIYDIFNSPLQLKLHFENGEAVPRCTYGDGRITGFVFDANTLEPIKYARVCVYKDGDLKAITYTDEDGGYKIVSGLPVGMVNIKISATGYRTYTDNRQINRNAETYIESYMMVERTDVAEGKVSGRFVDAVTGSTIDDVTYEVRQGWNNTTGNVILTATVDDSYNFNIVAGNYTIYAKAEGYAPGRVNVTVTGNANIQADITLSPVDPEDPEDPVDPENPDEPVEPEDPDIVDNAKNLRIILTWGATPSDLDSHLFGSDMSGSGTFHTYYSSKNYNYNSERIADLDLDDTSSYGPETTTIYKMNPSGKYSYYIHDYTNKNSSSSTVMSRSGAKVEVYNGNTLFATFNVPVNVGGTVWHVFDYDAQTGYITPVNTMHYSSDPGTLGRLYYSSGNNIIPEIEAINIIRESTKEDK